MEQDELNHNRRVFANINKLDIEDVHPIPKVELVVGKTYKGNCRNSDNAVWDGKVFWYDRHKFGSTFRESINHYEDDDGYDVFVPFETDESFIVLPEDSVKKLSDRDYWGTIEKIFMEITNLMTEKAFINEAKHMYPNMSDEDIRKQLKNMLYDNYGNIVRGADMFDFSGKLKGEPGTPGK
jgi:hypothetical protein